jgi:hypothetical protein
MRYSNKTFACDSTIFDLLMMRVYLHSGSPNFMM